MSHRRAFRLRRSDGPVGRSLEKAQTNPERGAGRGGEWGADAGRYAGGVITFLLRAGIFLVSAALGLIVASFVVTAFHISWGDWWGFVLAIVLFAIVQSIIAPLATRVAKKRAPILLGGVGILATFVSIAVVVLIPRAGIGISTPGGWLLAPLVVWLVSALVTWGLSTLLLSRQTDAKN